MSHHVSDGWGELFVAIVLGILAWGAMTTGEVHLGRVFGITIDRRVNPIFFWGYVLFFGACAALVAEIGIVHLVRPLLSN
jgi:hypothetical protein